MLPSTPTSRSIRRCGLTTFATWTGPSLARDGVVHREEVRQPVFDTTLVGVSAEFERIVNNACQ